MLKTARRAGKIEMEDEKLKANKKIKNKNRTDSNTSMVAGWNGQLCMYVTIRINNINILTYKWNIKLDIGVSTQGVTK